MRKVNALTFLIIAVADYNLPKDKREIFDRIVSDYKANTPDTSPELRNNYIRTILIAFAYRCFDIYQKIKILIRESFLQTAEFEDSIILEGKKYGIAKLSATPSSGFITITGTPGTLIKKNTEFQAGNGITYKTKADSIIALNQINLISLTRSGSIVTAICQSPHNLASGVVIDSIIGANETDFNDTNIRVTVTSETKFTYESGGIQGIATGAIIAKWNSASVEVKSVNGGEITNLVSGTSLNILESIDDVDNSAFVQYSGINGGVDEESLPDYKKRILFRIQNPHSYFNENEIITQAKKVNGISRVWVFGPNNLTGSKIVSSLTRIGQIAIANIPNHNFRDGAYISVFNANQEQYNVAKKRILTIDNDNFCFVVQGSPPTPATGTINIYYTIAEPGQVKIYCATGKADIIPTSTDNNNIKAEILKIKPAHTDEEDIMVLSPTPREVNFSFSSLTPNTPSMRSAINNAITDYFKLENNVGKSVAYADLHSLIATVIDSSGLSPVFTLSLPNSDIAIDAGQLAVKGNIIYP